VGLIPTATTKFSKKENYYAKSNRRKSPLTVVGETVDGKKVVRGTFLIHSSITGLPLEDCLKILKENNMVVDWLYFIEQSQKHNWKMERTLIKIETAVSEVYGKEYCNEVMKRINGL
jgi:hypothetical protein